MSEREKRRDDPQGLDFLNERQTGTCHLHAVIESQREAEREKMEELRRDVKEMKATMDLFIKAQTAKSEEQVSYKVLYAFIFVAIAVVGSLGYQLRELDRSVAVNTYRLKLIENQIYPNPIKENGNERNTHG